MTTIHPDATWTRLHDGTWGIKGAGLEVGTVAKITSRKGEVKWGEVTCIVWTNGDIAIAEISRDTYAALKAECGKEELTDKEFDRWVAAENTRQEREAFAREAEARRAGKLREGWSKASQRRNPRRDRQDGPTYMDGGKTQIWD